LSLIKNKIKIKRSSGIKIFRRHAYHSANGLILPQRSLKGVLNPNFRPYNFELNKNRFFKMNFDLGFKVLTSETEDV